MEPERAPARPKTSLRAAWAVIEPLLVLAAASLLTLGLSLAFIPMEVQVEVALRPAEGGFLLWTPDVLADHVRELGLSEEVRLVKDGSERTLLLLGVTDLGATIRQVREFLVVGGYELPWFRTTPQLDINALVLEEPDLLPKFLTVQAAIFLVAGSILAGLRVDGKRFAPRSGRWRAVLLGLGGGIAAILLSVVMGLLLKLVGWPVHEQAWLEELLGDRDVIWRLAPWIVVVVPIAEEVFFRAYMLRFMAQRLGFLAALILSSIVFAAIHLNPSGFPVYVVIAAVMAWVYRRSGSLVSPILAHMTLNGTVLLVGTLVP
jgi:membrane protease YdiL (CAAX protease family)